MRALSARGATALGLALAATATVAVAPACAAVAATVCNRYCDGRDPALSPGDRQPVSATIYARRIVLHVNDTDAMAWALDRQRQPRRRGVAGPLLRRRAHLGGGSRLGDTAVPAGSRGWRTAMFNVDDWANHGVGAVRACGRPATGRRSPAPPGPAAPGTRAPGAPRRRPR